MLHLRHWNKEVEEPSQRHSTDPLYPQEQKERRSPRVLSSVTEDQILVGEIYYFPEISRADFPDCWKPSPSDTRAA